MVTPKRTTYKEATHQTWQHWPISKWIFIEETARDFNLPQHQVIYDMYEFVRQDQEHQLEFRRYLKTKHPDTTVQKGTTFQTTMRRMGIVNCPRCGLKGTEKGLAYHIKNCSGRNSPMNKLEECEITC